MTKWPIENFTELQSDRLTERQIVSLTNWQIGDWKFDRLANWLIKKLTESLHFTYLNNFSLAKLYLALMYPSLDNTPGAFKLPLSSSTRWLHQWNKKAPFLQYNQTNTLPVVEQCKQTGGGLPISSACLYPSSNTSPPAALVVLNGTALPCGGVSTRKRERKKLEVISPGPLDQYGQS